MTTRGFWKSAEAEPERIALILPDGRSIRAGELFAAGNRLVHGLRALGLAQGDCIATLLPNGTEMLEALAAAMQAGWYLTPLNTNLAAPEIAYVLRDSGARALIAHVDFADKASVAADAAELPAAARFAVGGAIDGFADHAAFLAAQPATRPEARSAGQFLQYTSGTTGRPKGIRRAPVSFDPDLVIGALAGHLARFDITPRDGHVHLTTSPMYHTAPLAYTWFSLNFEHPVVLMEHWDAEESLRLIERHRVSTTHMVPTQFHRLLQLPEATRFAYDLSSLRVVLHAAAPCPVEVKRRMLDWWGPVIYEYYGASEGGGTLIKPQDWLAHPGSVGRAWEGAEIRILDDAGNELAPNQVGTVYMKLIQDFRYEGDTKKTQESRRGDFFTVGDVGYLDPNGYLFLCDRKIDMIISGGVNIYPAEIEAALYEHPAVADAAVFGIPDEEWGEAVKAVVEARAGHIPGPALEAELLDFCRGRLAKYKCPRSIDFLPALPRDPSGKLYKRKLRDPWWEGRERAI